VFLCLVPLSANSGYICCEKLYEQVIIRQPLALQMNCEGVAGV